MLALPTAAALGQTSSGPETTVRDGVFNADQAKRGRSIYDTKCASCHDGGTMGPELWGDAFLERWENKSVGALFAQIQTTMPEDTPGSLKDSEVLDLIAYVLQTNGFPPGEKTLENTSGLTTMKFVRK